MSGAVEDQSARHQSDRATSENRNSYESPVSRSSGHLDLIMRRSRYCPKQREDGRERSQSPPLSVHLVKSKGSAGPTRLCPGSMQVPATLIRLTAPPPMIWPRR